MNHVIVRVGTGDTYDPALPPTHRSVPLAFERPGDPQAVRTNVFEVMQDHGLLASNTAEDLFRLAASVYCADTRVARSTAYDDWTRAIILHLPVHRLDLWRSVEPTLTEMLSFLTGDHWELRLREACRPAASQAPVQVKVLPSPPGAVSLFSGGLDSFIGAVDRLEAGEPLGLVSHYGIGMTNSAQERTLAVLKRHYPNLTTAYGFYVVPPLLGGQMPERTTRSRSILFLTLGTLVATGIGGKVPLIVPENGFISLNPPLTLARTGSASTRTTHPHYVALFRSALAGLGMPAELQLPYRFQTKGQMAAGVLNTAAFQNGVHQTLSCSHPEVGRFQGLTPGQHCGYCVPCIIRRAALAAAGHDDPLRYDCDVLRNPPAANSQTGRDLRAFQMAARRFNPEGGHRHLFEVLSTGPIPPDELPGYVEVYRCGMREVRRFLGISTRVNA